MNEPDFTTDLYDYHAVQEDLREEHNSFTESWASSNEDGWFYADDDGDSLPNSDYE